MDTGIVLVRHGETQWNKEQVFRGRSDIPLNDNGLRQAAATGKELQGIDLAAVFCSPLTRAYQTAEVLCRNRNMSPLPREAFTDLSFGDWEGMTYPEVARLYPQELQLWHDKPHRLTLPGGETLDQAMERSFQEMKQLAEAHRGQNIAIVSHRVILKLLILKAMDLGSEGFWGIKQDACCINILEYYHGRRFVIARINESCHLHPLAASFNRQDF